ncbi:uncharacterized protein DSM5745_03933 [Aspergillus mulundensis]|uniref:Uncharacterized protein n=1 Tax=Aspergillus mulundensis TaxID=1810919 RepID=A0A3D8SB65_9EURO|nr:hypothetical protein DSM5745_03933 [Aspergillus mulundensis]RDW83607.1 hypothetical protein DSM5745_03933 [Aspergillus mulundensis]
MPGKISAEHPECFKRLNNQVSLWPAQPSPEKSRTLLVLCAWLFASQRHILKYVQLYQEEYPNADILLIQPVVGDMVWTSDASQLKTLDPAVDVLRSFTATSNAGIRFHVFSNAGSHAAVQLVEAHSKNYPTTELRINALVLDSCPGSPSAILSANAMILALPRNFLVRIPGTVLIYLAIAVVAILDALGLSENVISKTRRHLNDPGLLFLRPGVQRTYVYSKSDRMVPYQDILEHAKEATSRLRDPSSDGTVWTVEFNGSGHVGHLAVDREKYHGAIF